MPDVPAAPAAPARSDGPAGPTGPVKVLWLARLERRFHAWRERRARRRGHTPTVAAYPGYGGETWVRVVGRVLIVPPVKVREPGDYARVRGWRSFASVPVGYAQVSITVGDTSHDVVADRGGVVDTVLPSSLEPGWRTIWMRVEDSEPVEARVFIVASDLRFGIVSDIDDTVMVTALPRPMLAAWNSFVVDEHARVAVPGMAVMMERLVREHPGAPIIYLSTGAWNVAPTLLRFLHRNLYPAGSLLLTDWGPTSDRWFRSGKEHKLRNLRRLPAEFPQIRWLLIGDDGQLDDTIYTTFAREHPDHVAAVAIRRLSPAEAVLAGGRTVVDRQSAPGVPWVTESDGAGLADRLVGVGVLERVVDDGLEP